ncbi:MAG: hypothetical protein AAF353_08620 [Pseudomonadota bacterium]
MSGDRFKSVPGDQAADLLIDLLKVNLYRIAVKDAEGSSCRGVIIEFTAGIPVVLSPFDVVRIQVGRNNDIVVDTIL